MTKTDSPMIFVINPGSTSTKVALYRGRKAVFEDELQHSYDEVAAFPDIVSQATFRRDAAVACLESRGMSVEDVDVFVGRGGLLRPVPSGAFKVNRRMLADLKDAKFGEHASNLGAPIAWELSGQGKKPAYIANPVVVDELCDEARITGVPGIVRECPFHALSHKAVAEKAAAKLGKPYEKCNFIVGHFGGGITIGAHRKGQVIDVNNGLFGEGPFTPQRSGGLTNLPFMKYCETQGLSFSEATKLLTRESGFSAHLGTDDMAKIERDVAAGKKKSTAVYEAFIYQVAKWMGGMAAVLDGKVDAIVVTGGLVRGKMFIQKLRRKVKFIAPLIVIAKNSEMEALASAAMDIAEGRKKAKVY
jgi:butyrate kinase